MLARKGDWNDCLCPGTTSPSPWRSTLRHHRAVSPSALIAPQGLPNCPRTVHERARLLAALAELVETRRAIAADAALHGIEMQRPATGVPFHIKVAIATSIAAAVAIASAATLYALQPRVVAARRAMGPIHVNILALGECVGLGVGLAHSSGP